MEEKTFDYINVVPLVDVMLVLLVIVLTTSSFIATGMIPLNLPKASHATDGAFKTQTIEIDQDGQTCLNGRRVSPTELKTGLAAMNRNVPVLIRADRSVRLQSFVSILDIIKNLEFNHVSLQTEEGI